MCFHISAFLFTSPRESRNIHFHPCGCGVSVSEYVQMDVHVFTSAKSAQYVEILGQGHKQKSKILKSYVLNLRVGRNAWLQQHSSARKVGTIRRAVEKVLGQH